MDADLGQGGVNDFEVVKGRLKEINRSYHEKSRNYDTFYEQYQRAAQEILLKRQALDAFIEAIQMFEEQVRGQWIQCGVQWLWSVYFLSRVGVEM